MLNLRDDDPLARVLAPPPNETAEDRQARLRAEAEAKRISDAIDEELQQQRNAERRAARPIKILLLGMSHRHTLVVPSAEVPLYSFRTERVRCVPL